MTTTDMLLALQIELPMLYIMQMLCKLQSLEYGDLVTLLLTTQKSNACNLTLFIIMLIIFCTMYFRVEKASKSSSASMNTDRTLARHRQDETKGMW